MRLYIVCTDPETALTGVTQHVGWLPENVCFRSSESFFLAS